MHRTDGGYRQYAEADVRPALHPPRRDLGFLHGRDRHLLGLWRDKSRASSQVKDIAQRHIDH
jgi:hypothetical protein